MTSAHDSGADNFEGERTADAGAGAGREEFGWWRFDQTRKTVSASEKARKIYGLGEDQWTIEDVRGVPLPQYRDELDRALKALIEQGHPYSQIFEIRRPSDQALRLIHSVAEYDAAENKVIGTILDITDRQRVEERERTERQRLEFIIDGSGLGTWEWNVQTNETVFNEAWAGMLGHTLAELKPLTYDTWRGLVHPEDLGRAREHLDRCMSGESRFYTCEFRMRHKDGHWVWILDRGQLLARDAEGRPLLMFGTHDDITERKHAEEALRERQQTLAAILETTMDGFWLVDSEGRIHDANPAICQLSGYPREEMLQHSLRELDAMESPEETKARMRRIMERGSELFETALRHKDGRAIPVEVSSTYLDRDGGRFISFCRDLTQRRQDEKAVAESTALLENLAGLVPGVIYQYRLYPDGRSCFPYASAGVRGIYEVTPEEVRENAAPALQRLHPEDYDRVLEAILESARTLALFYCEFRVVLPTRGLRWCLCESKPQRTEDGGTLWHGIITDITERKRAEEEREKLQKQLTQSQRLESVGRLAGGVAHDFNNMLNVILGHADLMLQDLEPSNPLRDDVEQIYKSALRSADLTRQLLAFARKQTVAPKVLNLNQTIDSMFKMLKRLIGEDINLQWLPAPELLPIHIDPAQIDQILANLIVNARDAIGPAAGNVTIETGMAQFDEAFCAMHEGLRLGRHVMLAVRDDGCGMDEGTLAQIFEPFFTTKGLGEGTGLGLATIYGIVKQNEGWIDVSSELGKGATFRIYLPVHEAPPESAEHGPDEAIPAARGREVVLLVEDEPAILTLGRRMLERLGYTVLSAPSPGEALAMLEKYEGELHLLVTDVVMPGMNGLELARRVHALYPKIKQLFMSGYTADIMAHRGVLHDGVHLIEKPFTARDLGRKVREVLDG